MRAQIRHRKILPAVLSASALERVEHFWYIVGDDASELYRLNDAFELVSTIPLVPTTTQNNARAAKSVKFDLEGMTRVAWHGRQELLLFGSGSKTPTRDFCFRVEVTAARAPRVLAQLPMTALYNVLRADARVVSTQQLNLEAAAAASNEILLFQRGNISGNNAIATFDLAAFMSYLDGEMHTLPEPRITTVRLPHLQGRSAGFSAATILNESQILFAATVEDTPDEIQDGPTLGSFIGLLERGAAWRAEWALPVEQENGIAPIKIEGLACQKFARDEITLYGVTDADGEPSEILEIEIK